MSDPQNQFLISSTGNEISCSNCNKIGHSSNKCRTLCTVCHRNGHLYKNCNQECDCGNKHLLRNHHCSSCNKYGHRTHMCKTNHICNICREKGHFTDECKTNKSTNCICDKYKISVEHNPNSKKKYFDVEKRGIWYNLSMTKFIGKYEFLRAFEIFFPQHLRKYYSQWKPEIISEFVLNLLANIKKKNKSYLSRGTVKIRDFKMNHLESTVQVSYNANIDTFDSKGFVAFRGPVRSWEDEDYADDYRPMFEDDYEESDTILFDSTYLKDIKRKLVLLCGRNDMGCPLNCAYLPQELFNMIYHYVF